MAQAKHDMPMPAPPGPEHKRLEPMVGKFRAEVKMWMGPGEPMISTGIMVNKLELDGRFLCQEYSRDPNPGPFPNFRGRGFFGYNDVTRRYEGVWIDNASNMMQVETGTVDAGGKVWTMEGALPCQKTAQMMTTRSVVTVRDNDSHTMEMYFTQDGQTTKSLEINYTRVS